MKLILKLGKLFAVLILTVFIILITASFLLKDKVGFIILKSINKNLSTKLEVASYKLSFFKKFPKASLELKDVVVHSSHDFNTSGFTGINTDTLLSAHFVSLDFKLTDILKGVYTIERIGAKNGRANFYTDSAGRVNYNISIKNNNPGSKETVIDLQRINISDMNAYYNNLDAHLIINGIIKTGSLKSRISGSNIDFTAGTDMKINRFELYNFKMDKTVPARLDLALLSSKSGITFKKGTMRIDNSEIGIDGSVFTNNILDLNVTGKNLDLARVRAYLPDKYLKLITDYNFAGNVSASSKIKGQLNRKSNPHIEINWQLKNARIANRKSGLAFKDLSFAGNLSNGNRNRYETCSVSFQNFKSKLGSTEYTGSAILRNFNYPRVDLTLKGRVFPAKIKEFFNIQTLSTTEGSADLDLKITDGAWPAKNFSYDGLIDLKPEGNIKFNTLSIGVQNNKILFSDINGNLILLKAILANKLSFRYKGQNIKINGEFKNLPEWLSGRNVLMTAKADVSFDKLIPESFLAVNSASDKSRRPKAVSMPGDLRFDINFRLDSLKYKTFSSSEVEGKLIYQPKTLTFKSLKMKSLEGYISGDGFIAQNKDKSLMTKGTFMVKDINVNKAFRTFHNFGQSFLKAENIKGTLSGSLSLLFPVDSILNFHIKTLTAEGSYHLLNGALINFDPVKQLSAFIELSELENITFEQLDNDFSIRNNLLFIPQMEVKSSAADLSVNGKHSFDNEYEYHVKILLSEILSKKRVKNRTKITEFGVVEDDGLGRTSLLLKIAGKGETAKVGYDMKAAGTEVKTNFKKEKQSIKTILNQEYGWYKGDSTLNKKQPEQKKPSRFKIKWDDGEPEKSPPDAPSGNSLTNKK